MDVDTLLTTTFPVFIHNSGFLNKYQTKAPRKYSRYIVSQQNRYSYQQIRGTSYLIKKYEILKLSSDDNELFEFYFENKIEISNGKLQKVVEITY